MTFICDGYRFLVDVVVFVGYVTLLKKYNFMKS